MKKRSILLTCIVAVMALAMFVGCDNAPVIPSWPTGGLISQNVEMLEGQVIPADAFTVYATYTDGSKTFKNVAVTEVDEAKANGKADNGEALQYLIGLDYYGNEVYAKGQVTAYTVDHIEAKVADGVAIVAGDTLDKSDIIVTAFYEVGDEMQSKQVGYADIVSVGAVTAVGNEADGSVPATIEVTAFTDMTAKIEVTAAVAPVADIKSVDSITATPVIAAYDYTESGLPEIDLNALSLSVTYTDDDTDTVKASVLDGLTAEFVNNTTHEPLDESFGEYDFTTFSDVAIKVTYGDDVVFVKAGNIKTPEIKIVAYKGETSYIIGEALPEINPDDYRVTVTLNGEVSVLTDPEAEFVYYSDNKEYLDDVVPSSLAVNVIYKGIMSNPGWGLTPVAAEPPAPATLESISVEVLDTINAPAKQFYNENSFAAVDKDSLKVTAAWSDGKSTVVPSAEFNATWYYDEKTPLADIKTVDGEYDLSSVDHIYALVAYGPSAEGAALVEVPLAEPVPNGAYLVPEYKPVLGTEISWSVVLTNDAGRIGAITSGYKVWSGTASAELPKTVTDKAQGPYFVTYNGITSDSVTINAGNGFVTPAADGFVVTLAEGKVPYYGTAIPTDKDSYVISDESWTSQDKESVKPVITEVKPTEILGQTFEETNTMTVVVSYPAESGETVTVDVDVVINSVGWVKPADGGLKIVVDGKSYGANSTIPAKEDYQFSDFTIDPESYELQGNASAPVIKSMATANGTYQVVEGTPFILVNGGNLAITVEYAQQAAEAKTETITLNGGTV